MNTIPITYLPGFSDMTTANALFETLRDDLDWVRHDKTPRSEYYANVAGTPYTYGTPPFARTYQAQPWTVGLVMLRQMAEKAAGCKFDVVFLNRYHDQTDHLGWHADDSPEMDDERPIAIISLGVERDIWFRGNDPASRSKPGFSAALGHAGLKLEHGSMCLMHAGMQDTHQHRIPKAGFQCGERISLTFRGLAAPEQ